MKFPAQFLKVLCPGIDPHIARWTVTPTVRVLLSYARIATSERVRSLSQIGLVGFDMRAAAINSHQAIFSNSASRRSGQLVATISRRVGKYANSSAGTPSGVNSSVRNSGNHLLPLSSGHLTPGLPLDVNCCQIAKVAAISKIVQLADHAPGAALSPGALTQATTALKTARRA